MTSRILPFEEWHLLPDSLDPILVGMRPGVSRVLVVEDQGAIVGHWLLFPVLHAECIYIAPAYRKTGGVARRLLRLLKHGARSLGFDRVWTASDSPDVTALLAHPRLGGVPVPALPVILPVGESACLPH